MRILVICIGIMLLVSCKNGHVLDIHSLTVPAERPLVFGSYADVLMPGTEDTAFVVAKRDQSNTIYWSMHHPVYVKLGGKTLNRIDLDTLVQLTVGGYTLTRQQLLDKGEKFRSSSDNVKYIAVQDILQASYPREDLSSLRLRSVYACNRSDNTIILLDTTISIQTTAGRTVTWKREGSVSIDGTTEVEFFKTLRFSSVSFSSKNKFFSIGDTVLITRVKPLTNSFGSDKTVLTYNKPAGGKGSTCIISFYRPYRNVMPDTTIRATLDTNKFVYVSQELVDFKPGAYMYVEDFSAGLARNPGKIDTANNFILSQDSGISGYDFYAIGFNWRTISGYLPLAITFLLGLFFLVVFFRGRAVSDRFYENNNSDKELLNWRNYYIVLYSGLFVLLTIRIYIGYNLSYSYPFFPFAYDASRAIAPMILQAVLITYVLFWRARYPGILAGRLLYIFTGAALLITVANIFVFSAFYQEAYARAALFIPYHFALLLLTAYCLVAPVIMLITTKQVTAFAQSVLRYKLTNVKLIKKEWPITVSDALLFLVLAGACIWFFGQDNAASSLTIPWIILAYGYIIPTIPWFNHVPAEKSMLRRVWIFFCKLLLLLGPPAIVLIGLKGDAGYLITLPLFAIGLWFLIGILYKFFERTTTREKGRFRANSAWGGVLILASVILFFVALGWFSAKYSPGDSARLEARVTAMYDFGKMQEYGYNETEQIAQFFAVLGKYSVPASNDQHERIHTAVSSFTDPVVKNDLSVPYAFIYASGKWWPLSLTVLFAVFLLLLFWGFKMSVYPGGDPQSKYEYFFTKHGEIRLLAVCIVCGTGIWLLFSYYGLLPFTGRLIYGLGQDSVAEVLETTAWFSLMGLVGTAYKE